jgi:hypothetical protein
MSATKEHIANYLERRAAGDPPPLALYRARCESAARQNLTEVYSYGSGQYLLEGIEGVPDGYRLTLTVHDDTDSRPDDVECFDPADIEAWREDRWRYVGIEVAVVDDDGTDLASYAVWGFELGDYWPMSTEAQIWAHATDGGVVDEALHLATERLERRATKAVAEQAARCAAVEAEIVRRARINTLLATIPPHVATELRSLIGA